MMGHCPSMICVNEKSTYLQSMYHWLGAMLHRLPPGGRKKEEEESGDCTTVATQKPEATTLLQQFSKKKKRKEKYRLLNPNF